MEWTKNKYLISNNKDKIDIDKVFTMLSNSYWASDRSVETIIESINNSLCFGLYEENKMIGFSRVVTDKVIFSYIMDVIIDSDCRGNGLGKWLLECILQHPDVVNTRPSLATKDAHGFYQQYGFETHEWMRMRMKNELE